jgi:YggT family protein
MNGFLQDVGGLLISVIFGIYIFMLILRLIFQILRADFYNPVSQAIVKITNPPLLPLRRIIPGLWGIDLASVVLILVLQAVELLLLNLLQGQTLGGLNLLLSTISIFLSNIIWIFLGAIFIRIILSWVSPYGMGQNPVVNLVYTVSEPILRPARRLLPPIAGLDFSPILAIVGLYILNMALSHLMNALYHLLR